MVTVLASVGHKFWAKVSLFVGGSTHSHNEVKKIDAEWIYCSVRRSFAVHNALRSAPINGPKCDEIMVWTGPIEAYLNDHIDQLFC